MIFLCMDGTQSNVDDVDEHLERVLRKPLEAGLTQDKKKCYLFVSSKSLMKVEYIQILERSELLRMLVHQIL